ncbi:hypothetical protein PBI_SMARTIES_6 [Microbacterium phage Smarties]|uniref:Uncharacterized protein n=1 Tax=Microbacterium phage Ariadne TaxID=2656546 RepID=A0A649VAM5_9CAUD|nr:hypothetical protein QDA10_gp006 [Microbacterium phage Ariadne]QGJ89411.1 hypothetical protein PBI_ARIADNE_6 [Microbacterium phage Ariadne]QGJ91398.1 hypothetical protein PBI_SMARTIES_6 [Microbacterium phage Smarties]
MIVFTPENTDSLTDLANMLDARGFDRYIVKTGHDLFFANDAVSAIELMLEDTSDCTLYAHEGPGQAVIVAEWNGSILTYRPRP